MDGLLADIVDLVGETREAWVNAAIKKIVINLVEEIAEGCGVAIAGLNKAGETLGEALLDGLLKDRAAHDGACGEETVEVTAGSFVEIAICFVRAAFADDTLTKMRGAGDGRLDELKKFKREGGAEEVVLLAVKGALDGLPGGCESCELLQAGEAGETLTGMEEKALLHLMGELVPLCDEEGGVGLVAGVELSIDDAGQDGAEILKSVGACELGYRVAEVAAGRVSLGHLHQLLFQFVDLDCQV